MCRFKRKSARALPLFNTSYLQSRTVISSSSKIASVTTQKQDGGPFSSTQQLDGGKFGSAPYQNGDKYTATRRQDGGQFEPAQHQNGGPISSAQQKNGGQLSSTQEQDGGPSFRSRLDFSVQSNGGHFRARSRWVDGSFPLVSRSRWYFTATFADFEQN